MAETGQRLVDASKQYIMVSVDGKENDEFGVLPLHYISSHITAVSPLWLSYCEIDASDLFTNHCMISASECCQSCQAWILEASAALPPPQHIS